MTRGPSDLARSMSEPPATETHPDNRCFCGQRVLIGWVGYVGNSRRVRICETGDHVVLGRGDPRVYIHVENPGDVIEVADHCWLCGGVNPNETVTVAKEYPNGPECPAYKTKVHTGCWQDMAP